MGVIDRRVRIAIAFIFTISIGGEIVTNSYLIAFMLALCVPLLLTSIVGSCPLYTHLHINTKDNNNIHI